MPAKSRLFTVAHNHHHGFERAPETRSRLDYHTVEEWQGMPAHEILPEPGTKEDAKMRHFTVNFGLPRTVFRMILELSGEEILRADSGFILVSFHHGTKKLSSSNTRPTTCKLSDRLDYVSTMTNGLCNSLAVEKLLNIEVPQRAQ
ncbi:hypothetical protein Agabi119p4_4920 [Agaricus bisporus var. burnettii]|uniref:Uncharacterized protein n=1 Tax=Agaricus bisporus var. burnettii TaxID=192524 RepID=A0A8H7F467_AGABI|nr:hypothetical protein Agabi119p4_4920 [Agaricus bisporus var. burnettii]